MATICPSCRRAELVQHCVGDGCDLVKCPKCEAYGQVISSKTEVSWKPRRYFDPADRKEGVN